jgi:myo-inositol-1(or 4)-monophosphatase
MPYLKFMDQVTLNKLSKQAQSVVQDAVSFIRSQVGLVKTRDIEIKSRNSLVSFVDKKSEEILVNGLRDLVPDPGFLTEEDTVENHESEYTWIIDPLDGTTNFLQQIPFFSVSVALKVHGEVVLGVVHDIMHQDVYIAWKGGGASLNGIPIRVSNTNLLEDAIVATGFPYYDKNSIPKLSHLLAYILVQTRGIRRFGSAALDLCYVACGRIDAFYETTLNHWDIAAGCLIVEEAGGVVTDFEGSDKYVEKKELLASSRLLYEDMLSMIKTGVVNMDHIS